MGATNFSNRAQGQTIREAFTGLVQAARYEHGHGGYTGTIAEKSGYVLLPALPEGVELRVAMDAAINGGEVEQLVEVNETDPGWKQLGEGGKFFGYRAITPEPTFKRWLDKASPIAGNKWGPAAAIEIKAPTATTPGEWVFFGLASE